MFERSFLSGYFNMNALLSDTSAIVGRAIRWWRDELRSFWPTARQGDGGKLDVVVAIADDGSVRLAEGTSGRLPKGVRAASGEADVWDYLNGLGRSRPDARVGLRLPWSACYQRRVEIPAAARRQAASILALDLERATPFKASDVYLAHYIEDAPARKGWLNASQLVAKRSQVQKFIADVEASGLKVASISCAAADGKTALPVDFLQSLGDATAQREGQHRARIALPLFAAALAISAAAILISRREAALEALDKQVESARASASAGQSRRDTLVAANSQSSAMRQLKTSRPAAIAIIDELTRLLPDTVYLSDLTMATDAVDLSGYARAAADVIPILERSEMFKDATLTAPVTFDTTEDKERFSLRVKLRHGLQAAAAKGEVPTP